MSSTQEEPGQIGWIARLGIAQAAACSQKDGNYRLQEEPKAPRPSKALR